MIIPIDEIKGVAAKLKLTLGGKTTSEILGAICFRNGKAITWNGATGTIIKLPLGFECCVKGEDFIDQIAKLSDDVDLELRQDTLHLKSGGLSARFKTFPALDFPDFVPKDRSELTADDPTIISALEAVLPFASKEINALGGICIVQNKVFSCNGKSATKSLLQKPLTHMIHFPDTFAKALIKSGNPVCLFRANEMVGAYYENMVLLTSQIVARFPHEMVNQAMEIAGPEVTLPEDLMKVLKRLTPATDEAGDVTLSVTGDILTVKADSAAEDLPWAGAPEFTCKMNLKCLNAAVKMTRKVMLGSILSDDPKALLFVGDNCWHTLGVQA